MSDFNFGDLDDLEAEPVVVEEKYEDKVVTGLSFGFIGVGQGGCHLADTFYDIGYRKVVLFNTTEKDMQNIHSPKGSWIIPEGMQGAGKKPEYGENAAKSVIPDLIKKLNQRFVGVSHIIVCVGAGGGSGTGAAAVFASACKQWIYNNTGDTTGTRVGFLVALPERSESSKVFANTDYLIQKIMNDSYSPILFVDNQRITQAVKSNALNRWNQANSMVCQLFHVFNMLCAKETNLGTFDPQDYTDVLAQGVMTMAMTSIPESSLKVDDETGLAKETVLSDKVKGSLGSSLLLQDVDISTATHAAILISCRSEALEQMDSNTIPKLSETVISMMGGDLGKNVTVNKGIYTRDDEDDEDSKIRIFLMFSGMQFPRSKLSAYAKASELKK